jgi:hypothetical protein
VYTVQQRILRVKIPFDFTVSDTPMPAGQYTIASRGAFLVLQSAGRTAEVPSFESNEDPNSGTKLVFDQYGKQNFLRKVLCSNVSSLSRRVAAGKAEKVARERAIEAQLPNIGQQTIVAARW